MIIWIWDNLEPRYQHTRDAQHVAGLKIIHMIGELDLDLRKIFLSLRKGNNGKGPEKDYLIMTVILIYSANAFSCLIFSCLGPTFIRCTSSQNDSI